MNVSNEYHITSVVPLPCIPNPKFVNDEHALTPAELRKLCEPTWRASEVCRQEATRNTLSVVKTPHSKGLEAVTFTASAGAPASHLNAVSENNTHTHTHTTRGRSPVYISEAAAQWRALAV